MIGQGDKGKLFDRYSVFLSSAPPGRIAHPILRELQKIGKLTA
jgi:hypothetical protein